MGVRHAYWVLEAQTGDSGGVTGTRDALVPRDLIAILSHKACAA